MNHRVTQTFAIILMIASMIVAGIVCTTSLLGAFLSLLTGILITAILFSLASILEHIEKMHEIMKRDYLKRYPEEDKSKNIVTADKQ